jgi:hypothetical protein
LPDQARWTRMRESTYCCPKLEHATHVCDDVHPIDKAIP